VKAALRIIVHAAGAEELVAAEVNVADEAVGAVVA
jgi:hypothetical protein